MNENKRFIECSHEVFPVLFKDTVDGKEFGSVYALDLLNELNDENIQLKQQLKRTTNAHERCRNTNTALHKDFDKLWRICMDTGLTRDEIIEAMDK